MGLRQARVNARPGGVAGPLTNSQRLKKLLAEQMFDNAALKDLVGKTLLPLAARGRSLIHIQHGQRTAASNLVNTD